MVENAFPFPGAGPGARRRGAAAHAAALGQAAPNPLGDLHALQLVGGRLARALRAQFEPLLRVGVKVEAAPIAVERFDAYTAARGAALQSVTQIAMPPLSAPALLVLDGAFTFGLVDLYFGGPGLAPHPLPSEFTPTAEAMIARLASGVADRLALAWAELAEIAFAAGRTETQLALAPLDGEDRVVRTRFGLHVGDARRVDLDILYPAAALKPIAAILSSRGAQRRLAADENPAWQTILHRSVMNVKLPVRSVLAEPVIPLAQLMSLKPGDIIPISFGPEIPLLVSDRRFARGAVGAANGRAAIRLHRIEPPSHEDEPHE